jgi:hypothetical protein
LGIGSHWATGLVAAWAVSKADEMVVRKADRWAAELAEWTDDSLVD